MMKKIILALALLPLSPWALAECKNANVYDDIACYEKELKSNKSQLNQTYQKLYGALDSEGKTILERAQKDWLQYKNSHCDQLQAYIARESLGAGSKLINLSCNAELIQDRIRELKGFQ